MAGGLARVRDLLRLVFPGRGRRVWGALTYLLYSDSASVGLRRDLRAPCLAPAAKRPVQVRPLAPDRSEEHTSELQSQSNLVCRLLLEKKTVIYCSSSTHY